MTTVYLSPLAGAATVATALQVAGGYLVGTVIYLSA